MLYCSAYYIKNTQDVNFKTSFDNYRVIILVRVSQVQKVGLKSSDHYCDYVPLHCVLKFVMRRIMSSTVVEPWMTNPESEGSNPTFNRHQVSLLQAFSSTPKKRLDKLERFLLPSLFNSQILGARPKAYPTGKNLNSSVGSILTRKYQNRLKVLIGTNTLAPCSHSDEEKNVLNI